MKHRFCCLQDHVKKKQYIPLEQQNTSPCGQDLFMENSTCYSKFEQLTDGRPSIEVNIVMLEFGMIDKENNDD